METSGSLEALLSRVREKAEAEAEAIRERAEKVAERELKRAGDKYSRLRRQAEERVSRKAEGKRRAARSEMAIRERRSIMQGKQRAVERVFTEALKRLGSIRDKKARRDLLVKLIQEGVDILGVSPVRVKLNKQERELALKEKIEADFKKGSVAIAEEEIDCSGGPVVSDETGRLVYENTFEARLERRQDELRRKAVEALGIESTGNEQ